MITKLTPQQSRRINALIRRECCNYDNGNCILLDDGEPCVCPQIITFSHIICKWCKSAVLPLDKELYIQLEKPKHTRVCAICGKDFIYSSNREKYCNLCKRTALLRRKKKYRINKGLRRDV
ncbi:MAG: conjugal transfer protein [Clostridia bacterium]|nr:conjugal transfer protein [Clostridia bacterium]